MAGTTPPPAGPANPSTAERIRRFLFPKSQRALFLWAILVWFLSFGLIAYAGPLGLTQSMVIAASLGTVTFMTFAAFYVEVGTDGMRTALAAALVVFFLALTSHLIASPNLRIALDTPTPRVEASAAPAATPEPGASAAPAAAAVAEPEVAFGRDIYNRLADFVKLILVFYFGAVTVERLASKTTVEGESDGEAPASPPANPPPNPPPSGGTGAAGTTGGGTDTKVPQTEPI